MANQKVVKKRRDREFRMDAARMVVEDGRTTSDVAEDLQVSYQTVASWVKAYKASKIEGRAARLSPAEVQLKAVMEENRKLKVQVEFLKKTMAYFVELPK